MLCNAKFSMLGVDMLQGPSIYLDQMRYNKS